MTADEMFTSVTRILPIGRHGPTRRLIGGAAGVSLCTWKKLLVISGNMHDETSTSNTFLCAADIPLEYRAAICS